MLLPEEQTGGRVLEDRRLSRQSLMVPAATIGESESFFDAVDEFFEPRLGPARAARVRAGAVHGLSDPSRAGELQHHPGRLPDRAHRVPPDLGRLLRGLRLQRGDPGSRAATWSACFSRKTSVPLELPAVAATFVVELGFDVAMGSLILIFAFTQGVFPKPPDFAKLNAFDLSYLAQHPRFTLFLLTLLAVGGLVAFAMLSARVKAFWERVRQASRSCATYAATGAGIRRPVRGWCCRFVAFWMLLEAFNVGGSVKNVLLVLGVNAVSAAVPFTPQGAGGSRPAREGVRRHGRRLHRRRVLGGPADRHRRAHVRNRLRGARVRVPVRSFKEVIALGREDRRPSAAGQARAPA